MSKKNVSGNKDSKAVGKVLLTFVGAVLAVAYLMIVYRFYSHADTLLVTRSFLLIAAKAGAVGAACAIILAAAIKLRKNVVTVGRFKISGVAAAVFFTLFAFCNWFVAGYYLSGIQLLCVIIPAAAVLLMIYYCYQREFFVISLVSGIDIMLLWFLKSTNFGGIAAAAGWASAGAYVSSFWMPYQISGIVAGLAATAACFAAAMKSKKKNGEIKLGGMTLVLFPNKANYKTIFISCGVLAAALTAALIAGATGAYFAMMAAIAYLFIMAVYFTVKMM